jgi:hypothetical protein
MVEGIYFGISAKADLDETPLMKGVAGENIYYRPQTSISLYRRLFKL